MTAVTMLSEVIRLHKEGVDRWTIVSHLVKMGYRRPQLIRYTADIARLGVDSFIQYRKDRHEAEKKKRKANKKENTAGKISLNEKRDPIIMQWYNTAKSAGEIARLITEATGVKHNANMVIGRANRLGLSRPLSERKTK